MNTSQFQELQKMQRIQQVQAQLRQQQQVGQRISQQAQIMSSGSLGSLPQGISQVQQGNQFANQQWLDPNQQQLFSNSQSASQRNSFSGMNSAQAMLLHQQQGTQSSIGIPGSNSLYWNAMQGNHKGSTCGIDVNNTNASSISGLGNMGIVGNSNHMPSLDSQMQALFQQQSLGNNQSSQMRGLVNQQHHGVGKNDISAMSLMNQQQLQHHLMQKMQGSSSTSNQGNSGNNSTQLLFQQQNIIAELKRRLAQQSGNISGNTNQGINDIRSTSTSLQQQQQIIEMHQRNSSNSMIQQAMASGLMQDPSMRGNSSSSSLIPGAAQDQNSLDTGRRGSSTPLLGNFDQAPGTSSSASLLMQQQVQLQQMTSGLNAMNGVASRTGQSEDSILAQQHHLMNSTAVGNMGNDMQQAQLMMGHTSSRGGMMNASNGNDLSSTDVMAGFNDNSVGSIAGIGSDPSNPSIGKSLPSLSGNKRRRSITSRNKKDEKESVADSSISGSQPFLDGTFIGGWQSNEDLADRRRVIYSICKIIEQMRPDASKMSERLPFISKRLEEHLYRSAQTKEEYLDPNTLKKRLQMIAQGLEVHRSSSSGSKKDNPNRSDFALSTGVLTNSSLEGPDVGGLSTDFSAGSDTQNQQLRLQEQMNQIKQLQQLQQIQQHQQFVTSSTNLESILKQQSLKEDMMNQTGKSGNLSASPSLTSLSNAPVKVNNTTDMNSLSQLQQDMRSQQTVSKSSVQGKASQGILKTGNSKYQDSHKRTVVKQQQERLLLLRHASKCKAGNDCKVRFCGQMVSLWKHMKKCRDKNCKTAHCLSSRCVLNHYRICKNENRTSVCEVCGPVMRQIKQQNNQVDDDDSSTQNKSIMPTQNDIQNTQSEFVSGKSFVMSNVNINSEISEKDGIEDIQLTQDKLHQQHMLLKELQNQQAQLLQQHKQLEQQQGPGLPQQQPGNELQQQLFLLEQLQQEFQQRQKMYLIQKSNVITNSNGMMNNSQISPGPSPLLDSDSLMASMSDNSNAHGLNNPELSIGITREIDDLNFTENNENITFNGNSIDVGKALDSSLSSSSIASTYNLPKTVVRRGSVSKGKQLSALESTIHHSNDSDNDLIRNAAMEAGIGVSSAYDGASAKRHKSNDQNFDGKTNLLSPDNAIGSTEDTSLVDSHEKNSKDVDPGVISPSSPQASRDSLEGQIQSKLTASAISQKYLPILRRLIDDKFGWVFRDAVDPVVLGLPDYFDVVKTPMHLSLVEQKLESFSYEDSYAVEKDIKLVFENAMLYNGAESDVGGMALKMIQIFEEEIKCFSSGR